MNAKRGEITIGIIIAVALGVVILILSIYALVINKSLLHSKIENTISSSTLDDLVLICNNEAQLGQQYNFCCEEKTLITEDLNEKTTCEELSDMEIASSRINGIDCEETVC
ncbi:hypothetical protein HN747_04580 [archaeon]|jgi:hypothetical protein|nr:hypothetical protein [archaeon]